MKPLNTYISPASQADTLLRCVEPTTRRVERLASALSVCGQAEEYARLKGAPEAMAALRRVTRGVAIKEGLDALSKSPFSNEAHDAVTSDVTLGQWCFLADQAEYLADVAEQAFALDLPSVAAQMLTYSIDSLARIALEADASSDQADEKNSTKKGTNLH
ncbi:hypothetical protein [Pseudidiomarina sp.]|uniref:hypothetical protein n=1 Tax=Pseudidiomarina sp. TaxID=2081707 RepID=UPI003A978FD1